MSRHLKNVLKDDTPSNDYQQNVLNVQNQPQHYNQQPPGTYAPRNYNPMQQQQQYPYQMPNQNPNQPQQQYYQSSTQPIPSNYYTSDNNSLPNQQQQYSKQYDQQTSYEGAGGASFESNREYDDRNDRSQHQNVKKCYECGSTAHLSKQCPKSTAGGIFKESDWICPMCNNRNQEQRDRCNMCQTKKPDLPDEVRTGRGGGYNEREEGDTKVPQKRFSSKGLNLNSLKNAGQDTVYISGLKSTVTSQDLKEMFGSIGVIKLNKKTGEPKIRIYLDKDTGKPKGDALITYDDAHTAPAAIEQFDGKEFQGQTIHVELAQQLINQEQQSQQFGNQGYSNESSDRQFSSFRGGRGRGRSRGGRGRGRGGGRGGIGQSSSMGSDPNEWKCEECGNINQARRTSCNRCQKPKPNVGSASSMPQNYGGSSNREQAFSNDRGNNSYSHRSSRRRSRSPYDSKRSSSGSHYHRH